MIFVFGNILPPFLCSLHTSSPCLSFTLECANLQWLTFNTRVRLTMIYPRLRRTFHYEVGGSYRVHFVRKSHLDPQRRFIPAAICRRDKWTYDRHFASVTIIIFGSYISRISRQGPHFRDYEILMRSYISLI